MGVQVHRRADLRVGFGDQSQGHSVEKVARLVRLGGGARRGDQALALERLGPERSAYGDAWELGRSLDLKTALEVAETAAST